MRIRTAGAVTEREPIMDVYMYKWRVYYLQQQQQQGLFQGQKEMNAKLEDTVREEHETRWARQGMAWHRAHTQHPGRPGLAAGQAKPSRADTL
jgi:hypothetical protein